MEKIYYNKQGYVCDRYPLDIEIEDYSRYIEVDEETYQKTLICEVGTSWGVKDGKLQIMIIDQEEYDKNTLEMLRDKRKDLLRAYDIYKVSVVYGDIIITEEERQEIASWYQKIKDLENQNEAEQAINNVPQRIQYYLGD